MLSLVNLDAGLEKEAVLKRHCTLKILSWHLSGGLFSFILSISENRGYGSLLAFGLPYLLALFTIFRICVQRCIPEVSPTSPFYSLGATWTASVVLKRRSACSSSLWAETERRLYRLNAMTNDVYPLFTMCDVYDIAYRTSSVLMDGTVPSPGTKIWGYLGA